MIIKIHVLKCGSTIVDEALPLSDRSKNQAFQSLRFLQAAAKDKGCVAILATHDREVLSNTIVL